MFRTPLLVRYFRKETVYSNEFEATDEELIKEMNDLFIKACRYSDENRNEILEYEEYEKKMDIYNESEFTESYLIDDTFNQLNDLLEKKSYFKPDNENHFHSLMNLRRSLLDICSYVEDILEILRWYESVDKFIKNKIVPMYHMQFGNEAPYNGVSDIQWYMILWLENCSSLKYSTRAEHCIDICRH